MIRDRVILSKQESVKTIVISLALKIGSMFHSKPLIPIVSQQEKSPRKMLKCSQPFLVIHVFVFKVCFVSVGKHDQQSANNYTVYILSWKKNNQHVLSY